MDTPVYSNAAYGSLEGEGRDATSNRTRRVSRVTAATHVPTDLGDSRFFQGVCEQVTSNPIDL
jgi:hypothetical protein